MATNRSSIRESLDHVIYYNGTYYQNINAHFISGWGEALAWYYWDNAIMTASDIYTFMKDSAGTFRDNHGLKPPAGWVSGNLSTVVDIGYNPDGPAGLRTMYHDFQMRKRFDSSKTVLTGTFGHNNAGYNQGVWASTNISMANMIGLEYTRGATSWAGREGGDGVAEAILGSNGGNLISIGNAAPDAWNPLPS